jgi:trans-aconitate 2-methyltransferase
VSGTRDWDGSTYDRISDPMLRMGAAVLARLPLRGDERVLDAGCGSGRVTELLLERLPRGTVVALDASASMLAAARVRLAPFVERVEFIQADLGLPLPVRPPVDAILSTATFHWVPDHDALFRGLAAAATSRTSWRSSRPSAMAGWGRPTSRRRRRPRRGSARPVSKRSAAG